MKKIMAVMVGLAFMAPAASMALPTLTLTAGSDTVVVADGTPLDLNPLANVVTYVGSVGPNWYLNVTTGQAGLPGAFMDLNSVENSGFYTWDATQQKFTNVLVTYPTTLIIDWTAPYIGPTISGLELGIGGTTNGEVTFALEVNGVKFFSGGPLTGVPFTGSGLVYFAPTGNAEFSQIVEIKHNAPGTTSFDYEAEPVPEPATLLMLVPMLGSGLYWSFRANRPGRKA